ncbi:hypothetical protein KGF56_000680 [Candida oxycetoniae]|uniref:C2H2-type domain-containing protein n=1 Tax=Candida oxycetoniae TaxID=497107 RepID=A0AAI9WZT5_9ASCO|nr:uncharacterized protein KGF56_000680 [Candida oxycetoniae]KAI3406548.2 hypothetical protein KGF56_000680 [Candida oxycetoniae]
MARAEIGTAKYESKRLKASGLQKLKFYCQICSKQCRDANGFKNHLSSKSHLGRMSNMENSGEIYDLVSSYSKEFQNNFISLLRVNHGNKFINANRFYQEYIRQKDHVHMNVTKWKTLTSFVRHLGQKGILRVTNNVDEETEADEDGFNLEIQLIDSGDFVQRRKDEEAKRVVDDDISERLLQKQVERGRILEEKRRNKEEEREEEEEEEREEREEEEREEREEREGKGGNVRGNEFKVAGPIKVNLKKEKKEKKAMKRIRNVFEEEAEENGMG